MYTRIHIQNDLLKNKKKVLDSKKENRCNISGVYRIGRLFMMSDENEDQ